MSLPSDPTSTAQAGASSAPGQAAAIRVTTRFAPSPTGELHLGNARTALFNVLLARHLGGRFILRVEDTDTERSKDLHVEQQLADLRWLGIDWDAGPDREDAFGPYRQSQRGSLYAHYFDVLAEKRLTYPCFCSSVELEVARRTQLAAGRPPRYAGTCRDLTPEQQEHKRASGIAPTTRFRVPTGRRIEFADIVHGPQSFLSDDIGDFIIRRADRSASFFFSNAVDDARMGVSHVLRGEDHLTNTPRQLLITEALGLRSPIYGHMALLVGHDGAKLSKRHGDPNVRFYRERGYSSQTIVNHLFRLGHSTSEHGFLTLEEMGRAFDPAHLGRAPAKFDDQQLTMWQKEWVNRLTVEAASDWLAPAIPAQVSAAAKHAFVEAVMHNVVLPEDAQGWAQIVFGDLPPLAEDDEQVVRSAGSGYFSAAATAAASNDNDLRAIVNAVKAATGRTGAALYKPLRLALTGRANGPELAPLLKAMPAGKARERLARFAA